MNKNFNNLTKISLASVVLISLTACSSNKPSESEAKSAIANAISDCSYLSLESFEKTNGIPIDDNSYRVEVKYTLKLQPDSDSKDMLEKWDDVAKQYREVKADYSTRGVDQDNAFRSFVATYQGTDDALRVFKAQHPDDPAIQEDAQKMADLQGQMTSLGGPSAFAGTVRAACPKVSMQLIGRFFRNDVSVDDLESGVSMEFTDAFQMQRSDNGWQIAQ